jgi:hypothetical protein
MRIERRQLYPDGFDPSELMQARTLYNFMTVRRTVQGLRCRLPRDCSSARRTPPPLAATTKPPSPEKLLDAPRQVGIGGSRMKGPRRRAVDRQGNGNTRRPADAVEMVLDVAEDKVDLLQVVQVLDHLRLDGRRRRLAGGTGA